ncbi:MAG: PorV/PorQ family protein [Candidatus Glassbacteria bacterium]|nr:PorV/PorQ family protein [Candidatus Glassbacteria bacterium]
MRAILTACLALSFVALPVSGQGVARQEYTGLDKYLEQGRPADASFVGVRAAEFLTIPVGARGIALGGAFTAATDDISAIWWNPAGLGFLEKRELMVTVVDYTLDLTYSFIAGAVPIADGNMTVGGFFGYLNIPEMEITSITNPNGTGRYFNAYDFQMGGSFAYHFSDRFIGGLNVKYIHQDMFSNISGNAFAIDAGAIYHTELMDREIRFAFAIQNLGTNITMDGPNLIYDVGPQGLDGLFPGGYDDYSADKMAISKRAGRQLEVKTNTYRLPTVVKLALAYNIMTTESYNWLSAGEIWRNSNIPISYSVGTEFNYHFTPFLTGALRMGWQVQTDEYTEGEDASGWAYYGENPTFRGLSMGGGFKQTFGDKHITFNYAYRNKGRLSADNFFTISFGF